jgi:hypothetical protein
VKEETDKTSFHAIIEATDMLSYDCLHIHATLVLVVSDLGFVPSTIKAG